MKRLFRSCWVLPVLALGLGLPGCMRPWRPPPAKMPVASQPAAAFDLRPYLQAGRLGKWTYVHHHNPTVHAGKLPVYEVKGRQDAGAAPPLTYTRVITPPRIQEGTLADKRLPPLQTYLRNSFAPASQPAGDRREKPPVRGAVVAFFELAEPMPPVPESLKPGEPITTETELRYYDVTGKLGSLGTLTRTAAIDGFEAVETPAGKFDDCLRLRVELSASFSWVSLNWTSHLWLLPKVGEVRRFNQMSGWFFIFPFSNSWDDQLAAYDPNAAGSQPALSPAATWARGLIVLSRVLPRPELAGLVVDFAKP